MKWMLRSKIHKARVTEANLKYIGSITIDEELVELSGLTEGEKVLVTSNHSGARLETYVIIGERGSGDICMNGAAAHLIKAGEEIIIMGFELSEKPLKPKVIPVDEQNRFVRYLEKETPRLEASMLQVCSLSLSQPPREHLRGCTEKKFKLTHNPVPNRGVLKMHNGDILILKGHEVLSLLAGNELSLLDAVEDAYKAHATGDTSLPHSVFLRFPDETRNRIIALPAYLGAGFNLAGVKWVSSFPGNLKSGLDRASATIIVNSIETGRPEAIVEASTISARRTAASAALAARHLSQLEKPLTAGIVGCGLINFEIVKLLLITCPEITMLYIFDIEPERSHQFKEKCREHNLKLETIIAYDLETVLVNCPLISLATTAVTPHIHDLSACRPGAVVLNVSLRDLSEQVILACDNVVDDVSHVCRAETSVHLAERAAGNRDFIRCTLAEVLSSTAPPKIGAVRPTIFSPFGLGILDLAVTRLVLELAAKEKLGTVIDSFLPHSWTEKNEYGTANCAT